METYAVELAASLDDSFQLNQLVLPGRANGHPPRLLAVAWFLLRAMVHCLCRGRRYDSVIFADLVMFPAAICHWLVARKHRRLVIVYGLDLVYQHRRGLLSAVYRYFFATFRVSQGVFSAIVAISRYTGRLAAEAGLRHVVVINPSLPRGGLVDVPTDYENLPVAWCKADIRVLYFGRLVPRKGALWYASHVVPQLPEHVSFFVVGQASSREFGEKLASCAKTYCLGRMDAPRLAAMIRQADLVVMPNISVPEAVDVEGFGLAAIEASALGGRLAASRIDGITDAVLEGTTGRLVTAGDSVAWRQATLSALATPADEVARQRKLAATVTRERFSRQSQANDFVRLLNREVAPT